MEINAIHNIELKNFKNFMHIDASFNECFKGDMESIAFIYGGNAAGKSNLISSLYFIYDLNNSLSLSYADIRRLSRLFKFDDDYDAEAFGRKKQELLNSNIKKIITRYKRKESQGEEMSVKISLVYKNVYYDYLVCCDDDHIIKEELLIRDNIRLTTVFSLEKNNYYLSSSAFSDSRFRGLIELELEQKFGSHTLVAILNDFRMKNNKSFMDNSLSPSLRSFLTCMDDIDIINNHFIGDDDTRLMKNNDDILPNLLSGTIKDDDASEIKFKTTIKFMESFYKKYLPEIDTMYYDMKKQDGEIEYELHFVRKNAFNEKIDLSYNEESFGNVAFTTLISIFYKVTMGQIIILDDIHFGLHDSILTHIMDDLAETLHKFKKIYNLMVGQLIIITQNTIFMTYEKRNNIYLLQNHNGQSLNPKFLALAKFNRDVQKTSNIRNRYIKDSNTDFGYSSGDSSVDLADTYKIFIKL